MIKIPSYAQTILDLLHNNHYEAFLVGGCVRDSLLGRSVNDYDITTNALPNEMIEVFKDYKCLDYGIQHGTVAVYIENNIVEVTTYRHDGEYINHRKPKQVTFTRNLKDDLERRDFTINALAYDNKVVDYFNGISDLENKLIRCVNESDQRFNEDALRILRALRFSSKLSFNIEQETKKSILKNYYLLSNISKERITSEFNKLICGDCESIFKEYKEVFEFIFNQFNDQKIYLLDTPNKDFIYRLSLFVISQDNDLGILNCLRYDNKTKQKLKLIINHYNDKIDTKMDIKKLLNKLGVENTKVVLDINNNNYTILENILQNNECFTIKQLDIKGNELNVPNHKISIYLNHLLNLVIEEKIDNNNEILLKTSQTLSL